MVFLSVAAAMAEADGRQFVTYASTAEDYQGFPDCRPAFVAAINKTLRAAGLWAKVRTPYVNITKKDVVYIGERLHVPFDLTWSCYIGGQEPCHECPACQKREAAFA
jgi:7-cyano-7-deazaguanine synthase